MTMKTTRKQNYPEWYQNVVSEADIEVTNERWGSRNSLCRTGSCCAVAVAELTIDEQSVVQQSSIDNAFIFSIVPTLVACRDVGTKAPVVALDDAVKNVVQLTAERT